MCSNRTVGDFPAIRREVDRVDAIDVYAPVDEHRHLCLDATPIGAVVDNTLRAAWAGLAIQAHAAATGEYTNEQATQDLLGNLLHWADHTGLDHSSVLTAAIGHYQHERAGRH